MLTSACRRIRTEQQCHSQAFNWVGESRKIAHQNLENSIDIWLTLSSNMQCPMQASSIIKLNVGGHYFTTSLQTLTKDPNSLLGTMFSGKYKTRAGEDGAVFIDRDGTHFRFILNFLRTGKLTLPEGATALAEFKEEADFYQILGILDELDDTKLKSEILTDEGQQNLLLSWLPPHGDVRRRRLRLLFRASRDGFAANTFHDKCDNKGPTIVLVQSGNYVFGGFTEKSWMCGKSCVECSRLHKINSHSK